MIRPSCQQCRGTKTLQDGGACSICDGLGTILCSRTHDNMAMGGACPSCGHASALHPGVANPGLQHCVLCEMEILTEDLRERIQQISEPR